MKNYTFSEIESCNMCGDASVGARVLGMRLNKETGMRPRSKRGVGVTILRCGKCGLHYSNPQPKPPSLADHYGIPPEEYWKNQDLSHDPSYFRYQIERAKVLLADQKEPIRAMDIGVGVGKAVTSMREAGFDVWGIEPSEPFHFHALKTTGMNPDRLTCVGVDEAEFAEGSFDFVTFGAVLEHVYDPASAIERTVQWLRPGGVWHAEIPSSDHLMAKLINTYFRLRGTNYVTNLSPMHSPFHIYEFTLNSFKEHAAKCGQYSIADYRYEVCSIHHVPRSLHFIFRQWMEKTQTGMQLHVWLRRLH